MTIAATIHVSPPLIEKEKKKLPWQNGYKGLFSAARDPHPHPHPHSFRQRGYTWINCAEQRLNYVGWRITQGSFCCPARTHSHPTLSCQQVFSSNSHSSKKRFIPLTGTGVAKFFFCFGGPKLELNGGPRARANTYYVLLLRCKIIPVPKFPSLTDFLQNIKIIKDPKYLKSTFA